MFKNAMNLEIFLDIIDTIWMIKNNSIVLHVLTNKIK
jgi:hypothetical protein